MDVKKDFEVTELAGNWVAGRRSPGIGGKLLLTEAEAHHALQLGELRLPKAKGGKPSDPPVGAEA